jgi:hypothetical protein
MGGEITLKSMCDTQIPYCFVAIRFAAIAAETIKFQLGPRLIQSSQLVADIQTNLNVLASLDSDGLLSGLWKACRPSSHIGR